MIRSVSLFWPQLVPARALRILRRFLDFFATAHSGVLIYKTVSDRLVTREYPREMGFIGRTAFSGSKFIYLSFFKAKKLLPLFSSIY